jgi:DNA-binding HxlR family transcriptional regulator
MYRITYSGMPKTYNQYCAAARALDIVGERWALLLVRELLAGPKRYKDLLAGLPGVPTNLLTARLRRLEAAGIVRRGVLPPPAGSAVYELTAIGRGLGPVLRELARWGFSFLGAPRRGEAMRLEWYMLAIQAFFRPEEASGVHDTYEFRIDDDGLREVFHVRVDDGRLRVGQGVAESPDLRITADARTLVAMGSGQLQPADAVRRGRVAIEGDLPTLERCLRILAPTLPNLGRPA